MDFAQYHSYNEKHPVDLTLKAVRGFHERYRKPVFVGEYGTDFRGWKPDTDPHLRALRQAIWSGAFSGAAGTGMSWWWQSIHQADRYSSWKSLASFLRGTGIGLPTWKPVQLKALGEKSVKALGVGGPRAAVVWILDSRYSWPSGALEDQPDPCSGVVLVLEGLEDGAYSVEWWDPLGGRATTKQELSTEEGRLRLHVPEFRLDTAVRLKAVGSKQPAS
jgi:hypothetical protein